MHSGWNSWINDYKTSVIYRYVRLRHNSSSNCQLAELQFTGQIYSTLAISTTSNNPCPVKVVIYQNTITVPGAVVNYSPTATSNVDAITPAYGPTAGGTSINIKGRNFGTTISVTIDGVACAITSHNTTNIICTTGLRTSPPGDGNSFIVISDSNKVIISC